MTDTDAQKTLAEALDEIFKTYDRADSPGLTVGISYKGKNVYRAGLGLACVQQGIANTPNTRMRIGSTSKHFTCLLALLLQEDGLLDIDAPASTYLPELSTAIATPTLRQFMSHTSGYRCSLDIGVIANHDAPQPDGWTLPILARQQEANFAPLDSQIYCNGGYHLLSLAIERVTGQPFEEVLRERILAPIGMTNTQAWPSDLQMLPNSASLHVPTKTGTWKRGLFATTDIKGEGSMISTVDDMLKWLSHLNNPSLIGTPETWAEMFKPVRLNSGHTSVYSLGLNAHEYRGVKVIHHGGGVIGGNSQMITVPEHDLNIAIHVNSNGLSASDLAWKVIDTVLEDVLAEPALEMAKADDFPHLVGAQYHGPSGVMIGFEQLGETLGTAFMASDPMPLLRDRPNDLYCGFEHVALGPLVIPKQSLAPDASGAAPETITLIDAGREETLTRLPKTPLEATKVSDDLLGNWFSNDANAEARFDLEDNALVLYVRGDYSGWVRWVCTPYTENAIGLRGPGEVGPTMALSVDRQKDSVTGFRLNGIRARNLRFVPQG